MKFALQFALASVVMLMALTSSTANAATRSAAHTHSPTFHDHTPRVHTHTLHVHRS